MTYLESAEQGTGTSWETYPEPAWMGFFVSSLKEIRPSGPLDVLDDRCAQDYIDVLGSVQCTHPSWAVGKMGSKYFWFPQLYSKDMATNVEAKALKHG